jgi:hypothetical protein
MQLVISASAYADPYTVTVIPGTELQGELWKPWLINDRCQILGNMQVSANERVFRLYERGTVRTVTAPQPFTRNASALLFKNSGEALIREGYPLSSAFLMRNAAARQLPPAPPRYPNGLLAVDLSTSGITLFIGIGERNEIQHSLLIRNRYLDQRMPANFSADHLNSALTFGGALLVDPVLHKYRPALRPLGRPVVQLPLPSGIENAWLQDLLESGTAIGRGEELVHGSNGEERVIHHALVWPSHRRLIHLNDEVGLEGASVLIHHASQRGSFVGSAYTETEGFQFLWDERSGIRKFSDLMPSAYEQIEWFQPDSINSAGQMVGLSCFREGPCQRVVVHPSDQRACGVQ